MQSRSESHPRAADASLRPATPRTGRTDVALVRGAFVALGAVGVPIVGVAAATAGAGGALGALAGLGLVAVLFGVAGVLQIVVARLAPKQLLAVTLGGLVVRVAVYLAVLAALGSLDGLHRQSLALATAAGLFGTICYELRLLRRLPQAFWVEPALGERVGRS